MNVLGYTTILTDTLVLVGMHVFAILLVKIYGQMEFSKYKITYVLSSSNPPGGSRWIIVEGYLYDNSPTVSWGSDNGGRSDRALARSVLLLLVVVVLLLKKVSSARLRKSDIHPISPKTQAPQYQPIDRKKRKGKSRLDQ